jgi:hypothetical protein
LVLYRDYVKADQRQRVIVRRLSGGEISGTVYQLETWVNNVEDEKTRITSGDKFYLRRSYITKLLDLHDEGWSRQTLSSADTAESRFFDPESL